MALTEALRLKMEKLGFDKLYKDHEDFWIEQAEKGRVLMTGAMAGFMRTPTVDDIKKILLGLIELVPELTSFLQTNKLRGAHWIADFADYILDRVYSPKLTIPKGKS